MTTTPGRWPAGSCGSARYPGKVRSPTRMEMSATVIRSHAQSAQRLRLVGERGRWLARAREKPTILTPHNRPSAAGGGAAWERCCRSGKCCRDSVAELLSSQRQRGIPAAASRVAGRDSVGALLLSEGAAGLAGSLAEGERPSLWLVGPDPGVAERPARTDRAC